MALRPVFLHLGSRRGLAKGGCCSCAGRCTILFNTPNSGFVLGSVYASATQAASAFAFSPSKTAPRITGVIPENAIDARPDSFGRGRFPEPGLYEYQQPTYAIWRELLVLV